MKSFIAIANSILLQDLPHDGVFVDFTMTDGYDTLYMAQYVSEGNVVAFEKNEDEVDRAYALFESNFQDNAHIVLDNPLNAKKYVRENINGFSIDAVKDDLDPVTTIKLIDLALELTEVGGKGMLIADDNMTEVKEHVDNMPESKVKVMAISMANVDTPTSYIIEKLA